MNEQARRIQRTYLVLLLGNTLAASFIWGINTLFLLDAGLSNLEAFAANAFFTAGMVVFEVPTGVVADTWGRRVSYLLGTVTLAGSTFLYWGLWVMSAPFWAWAVVSMLLGLGFTFFSGAVEAWLVDALRYAEYDGSLELVFGRGQMVAGAAMLGGSVAGGVIAQATNLGVPFLVRGGVLLTMFVVAWRLMYDLGFTREPAAHPLHAMRNIFTASLDYGLKNRPVRWVMLAAPFSTGVGIYVFYALQPYLLELYGDEQAYSIAGPGRRRRCRSADRGRLGRAARSTSVRQADDALILAGRRRRARTRPPRRGRGVLGRPGARRALGPARGRADADSAGVPQRDDPVAAARDRAVVRLSHGLERRRCDPAGARARRRRLQLRDVVRRRRGDPAHLRSVPRRQQAGAIAGRLRHRGSRPGRRDRVVTRCDSAHHGTVVGDAVYL